jgi:hypothetical protein
MSVRDTMSKPLNLDQFKGRRSEDVLQVIIQEINDLKEALLLDEDLRRHNPALQDAYEKYQLVKKLSVK